MSIYNRDGWVGCSWQKKKKKTGAGRVLKDFTLPIGFVLKENICHVLVENNIV